jgi:hypothetical protein
LKLNVFIWGIKGFYAGGNLMKLKAWVVEKEAASN